VSSQPNERDGGQKACFFWAPHIFLEPHGQEVETALISELYLEWACATRRPEERNFFLRALQSKKSASESKLPFGKGTELHMRYLYSFIHEKSLKRSEESRHSKSVDPLMRYLDEYDNFVKDLGGSLEARYGGDELDAMINKIDHKAQRSAIVIQILTSTLDFKKSQVSTIA